MLLNYYLNLSVSNRAVVSQLMANKFASPDNMISSKAVEVSVKMLRDLKGLKMKDVGSSGGC